MFRRASFLLVALLVLAAVTWLALGRPSREAEGPPAAGRGEPTAAIPVVAATARVETVRRTVEAVGTARSRESITVTSEVTGKVERIEFEPGEWVDAGDVLVALGAAEQEAAVAEARADLREAQRRYQRAARLAKQGIVPQAEVQDLRARMRAAEARLEAARARVGDLVIRAPFPGRTGLREVSEGALIEPGDVITTLDDTREIKVRFEVPETALGALRPGLPVAARTAAFPERTFEGRVTAVDARVDPETRSVPVEAVFPNADGALAPGLFFAVDVVVESRPNAVLVPEGALLREGDEAYVYVVRDGRAVRQVVETGLSRPGWVEIREGLAAGQQVVVEGHQKVQDGTPVAVLPEASEAQVSR